MLQDLESQIIEIRGLLNKANKILDKMSQVDSDTPFKTRIALEIDREEIFEKSWKHYPRNNNKIASKKAYNLKIKSKTAQENFSQACLNVGEYYKERDKTYVPYMQKFINQDQWRDWVTGPPEDKLEDPNKWFT